jgi:bifunctional non-homologous end joining protein LigD
MRTIRGARKAPMPGFVQPQLATLKAKPPGGDYLHEIKFDGYRVQPHISRGHATIYTRSGLDWTKRFRPIAEALDQNISAIFDGEVVVVENDRPNFSLLQADLSSGRKDRMALYVFDILFLDGQDLRDVPLIGRKQVLSSLRSKFRSPVFLSEHFDVDGPDLFESASRMGLEGIVSKRMDAPYKSGRTETWIKVKCVRKGRFPIVGFIPDVGGVSALYLGKREGKELIYAGKVGRFWLFAEDVHVGTKAARTAGDEGVAADAKGTEAEGEVGRTEVLRRRGVPRHHIRWLAEAERLQRNEGNLTATICTRSITSGFRT